MKDKKRQYTPFSFHDRSGIQAHMEKMASQGWMLEKITNFFWHYRRIDPKKIHFAVTYFPKASVFDPEPSENQQIFRDFCEHSGWKLAASSAQLEIYYNEAENPVPITTDALVELETIHKSAKKTILPSNIILLILGILQGTMLTCRFMDNIIETLLQNNNLFLIFCWLIVIIASATELVNYYRWYKRAKIATKTDGSFVETRSTKKIQIILLIILLAETIFWILSLGFGLNLYAGLIGIGFTIAILFLVNGIKMLLKKHKVSAKINRIVTTISCFVFSFGLMGLMVFLILNGIASGRFEERKPVRTYEYRGWTYEIYHDELPLYLEDLIDTDYEDFSYEKKEEDSIFLHKIEAVQSAPHYAEGIPELSYTVTKVKVPFLYGACLNELLYQYEEWYDERSFVEIDASPWKAKAAYQLYWDNEFKERYLICYEDCFIELNLYEIELLPEYKEIITEKLVEI